MKGKRFNPSGYQAVLTEEQLRLLLRASGQDRFGVLFPDGSHGWFTEKVEVVKA